MVDNVNRNETQATGRQSMSDIIARLDAFIDAAGRKREILALYEREALSGQEVAVLFARYADMDSL